MKLSLLLRCCIILVLFASLGQLTACSSRKPAKGAPELAADATPDLRTGFRGLEWGTELDVVEDYHTLEQCWEIGPEALNCSVVDANRSLGDVPLQHVRYLFFQERFYGVSLKYAPAQQERIRVMVEDLLGPPTGERDRFPLWDLPEIKAWASDTHFSVQSKKVLGVEKKDSGGTF